MEFQMSVEQVNRKVPVTVFHLSGPVNLTSADFFEAQARQAVQGGTRYLLLDFKNVAAIRSAGLRSVQVVYKLLTPVTPDAVTDKLTSSPYLKIANLSPELNEVFEIAGFLRNIATYPDIESALASFE
jgi:anti-anti-sigma regulatory factor